MEIFIWCNDIFTVMVLFSDSFLPKYFDLANCVKKNISIKKTPVQVKYLLGDILAWADITEYHTL